MQKNILLLLTACVNTKGMKFTSLNNKDERLRQYIRAINYYLHHTNYSILVVENSNCNLSTYISPKRKNIEFLTFDGNNYDKELGKGYGEALILDYATKNSLLYKQANIIVKITGRDIVLNIKSLIREIKDDHNVYANIESICGRLYCESRFAAFSKKFLEESFLPNIDSINDSKQYYFEFLLFDKAKNNIKEFFQPILINSVSGTTGNSIVPNKLSKYLHSPLRYFLHKNKIFRMNF